MPAMIAPTFSAVRRMVESAGYGVRFLAALPPLLRRPLTPGRARALVPRRLEQREADFLDLARRVIFRQPRHPYRRLLALAGCEQGDLEGLVWREGLDPALKALFRRGVYLTVAEFKRQQPIVRGSASFTIDPSELRNPLAGCHIPGQSGGTGGRRLVTPWDLGYLSDIAPGLCLYLDAVGGPTARYGSWCVPGGLAILQLIFLAAVGARPTRWFSQVEPTSAGLDLRYRWSGGLLRLGGLLAGVPLPRPETVPLFETDSIIRWMTAMLRAGGRPHLYTNTSAAVRLCQDALAAGIELAGARFIVNSEPLTAARQAAIRGVGADAATLYGSMETALISQPCAAGCLPDEMHLLDDVVATVQPGDDAAGRPGLASKTLLCTTLRRRAPFLFLNVSMGDQAEIIPARCGCPLQRAGWPRQIHSVRSFEQLNAGGMLLLDLDVIRVLEETLPARFGGGPLDYQLLESVDGDGRAALRLLVHPRLGPLDPTSVVDVFLAALTGDGSDRVRELQWRQGEMLSVERSVPRLTPAGKVLHLDQERAATTNY